ncbi:MAG: hypothetical protein NTW38_09050 [Candidatus Aminicenantes bacterium]|nr:hypothetical protein [Candidatus Aminicenantes bacterium]
MLTKRNRRLILRVAAALALGVAIIVAVGVIPLVRADTSPHATPGQAIPAFWRFVILPQVLIGMALFGISFIRRPGNRASKVLAVVVGLIALALGLGLLDAAMAYQGEGPDMLGASIALFICLGFDLLTGVIAFLAAIRFSETRQA